MLLQAGGASSAFLVVWKEQTWTGRSALQVYGLQIICYRFMDGGSETPVGNSIEFFAN